MKQLWALLAEDIESERVHLTGIIVRDLSCVVSNYRSKLTLDEYLKKQKVPGIANVDTRAITRRLRETGAMNGVICTDASIRYNLSALGLGLPLSSELPSTRPILPSLFFRHWPNMQHSTHSSCVSASKSCQQESHSWQHPVLEEIMGTRAETVSASSNVFCPGQIRCRDKLELSGTRC